MPFKVMIQIFGRNTLELCHPILPAFMVIIDVLNMVNTLNSLSFTGVQGVMLQLFRLGVSDEVFTCISTDTGSVFDIIF
jgi:hypothetical protein